MIKRLLIVPQSDLILRNLKGEQLSFLFKKTTCPLIDWSVGCTGSLLILQRLSLVAERGSDPWLRCVCFSLWWSLLLQSTGFRSWRCSTQGQELGLTGFGALQGRACDPGICRWIPIYFATRGVREKAFLYQAYFSWCLHFRKQLERSVLNLTSPWDRIGGQAGELVWRLEHTRACAHTCTHCQNTHTFP